MSSSSRTDGPSSDDSNKDSETSIETLSDTSSSLNEYYDNNIDGDNKEFKFYSNKIDALINQIKNILQNDRDDPNIAEVINNTPNFVRLKIYIHFLTNIPSEIVNENVLHKGLDMDDVNKAKTLNELYNFVRSDDIFNGDKHKYYKSLHETVAEVAAAKAFKHIYPDKGLDEMEFI